MYLVYTAMLALNVSAEVINGFKTVGNAMQKSNENMEMKLQDTYDNFEFALKNNPAKVQDKYDKAMKIQTSSRELVKAIDTTMYSFIGELATSAEIILPDPNDTSKTIKRVIPLYTDGKKNMDSIAMAVKIGGFSWIQKLDDNHKGTPIFVGKGEGVYATEGAAKDLKENIIAFKHQVNGILGEDSVHVKLGLDVESMTLDSDKKKKSWEMLNFNNTVAGAALVTLVRMKAEVLNAEFDAVNMLYKQVKSNDFSFDKIAVIARPSSSYVMRGGKYELVVNVGAYDSKTPFRVTVGGQSFSSNDSGAVVYNTVCNATGLKKVTGNVVINKDGEIITQDFTQSYYVAEPMAVFELTEMNVVYSGINNPVRISVPGTAAHDVMVSLADPSSATIAPDKEKGAGNYIIVPKVTKGELVVNASIRDGKATRHMGSTKFRVRQIPDPKITFCGVEAGRGGIPINKLKAEGSRIAVKYGQDFAFHMKLPVVKKMTINITKVPGADDLVENGPTFGSETLSYLKKAKAGCKVMLDVDVLLPDGKTRSISGSYRITR